MLVECTVQIGGAQLITIRQLASPVQSLKERKKDGGLAHSTKPRYFRLKTSLHALKILGYIGCYDEEVIK